MVQLQDITGIDDLQICRALLESNNWDLEATAREQLNLPQSSQDQQAPPRLRPLYPHPEAPELVRPVPRSNQNGQIRTGAPVQVAGPGILSWTFSWLTWPIRWPINFAFHTFAGIFQFVASFLGFGETNRNRRIQFWPPTTSFDARVDVQNFIDNFNATFGLNHPTFFAGTYSQVLEKAKLDLQFLLVYLHSPGHGDTPRFCRGTLSNPEFVSIFVLRKFLSAAREKS